MANHEILKMLHEELVKKADSKTIERIKGAKSKDEALSILEEASIDHDDELLAAVSGGTDDLSQEGEDKGLCWTYGCKSYECTPLWI